MENNIFFHIATMGNYQEVVDEISSKINDKFDNVFVGIVGDKKVNIPSHYKILYQNDDVSNFEFLTLEHLQSYCKGHICNVLYVHTKGITAEPQYKEAIDDWRKYMTYFLVEKNDKCIEYLNEYDICGVDWRGHPVNHFSGNFWWATSNHINQLPDISQLKLPTSKVIITIRHNAEFWIGMKDNIKVKVLFDCGISQYERHLHAFKKEQYIIV